MRVKGCGWQGSVGRGQADESETDPGKRRDVGGRALLRRERNKSDRQTKGQLIREESAMLGGLCC